ncbi:hypothetical protein DB30_06948 [Enhygromyxa salina]|uniref:SLH domain-containing protein n=1 Tax=Enhygromyxa salina TaxID=215803 RepID=A0A0C2CT55_9BACT|nr:M23 family metallopeptidase [Enhygromyxa salina]KIG14346.1 hypothetical protein DB30_06948 [Enhygromyxa salina]
MKNIKTLCLLVAATTAMVLAFVPFGRADEGSPEIITGETIFRATDINQIPLADFNPPLADPNPAWRVSQVFNTTVNDPHYAFGHNGLDLGGSTYGGLYDPENGIDQRKPGIDKIHATMAGKVLVSNKSSGWGNSIVIAARLNLHSDIIITTHYHHLHERYVEAGLAVSRNYLLGLEGMTGRSWYLPHLHLTVRQWANLAHLQAWLDGGLEHLYGGDAYFENEADFLGKPSPGAPIDPNGPFARFGYLDPEPLVKDYFIDITSTEYTWAESYAKKMRYYGIDLGLWNGEFGAGLPATRREAARWIRVALGSKVAGASPLAQFSDVPNTDPDYNYIHDLTTFPYIPVIKPDRVCTGNSISFCPDDNLNRAEALKMITLAFYPNDFSGFWDLGFWKAFATPASVASMLGPGVEENDLFTDVDIYNDWYAPYVYFGVSRGFINLPQPDMNGEIWFNPGSAATRAHMAKWVVMGYERINDNAAQDPCEVVECPISQYCDPALASCVEHAECVPTEEEPCEVGGGAINSCPYGNGLYCGELVGQTSGSLYDCVNGNYTLAEVCENGCQDAGDGNNDYCIDPQSCPSGNGLYCGESVGQTTGSLFQCTDGSYSLVDVCAEGCQDAGDGFDDYCINNDPQCDCNSGICCDGCNFRSSNFVCDQDADSQYSCSGNSCGDDLNIQFRDQLCPGNATSCTGGYGAWGPTQVAENCSVDQTCSVNNQTCVADQMCMCSDTYGVSQYQCNSFSFADNGGGGGGEIFEVCASVNSQTGFVTIKAQKGDNSNFGNRPYQVRVSDPGDDPCGPNTHYFVISDSNPSGVGTSQLTFTFQSSWGNESSKAYCVTASTQQGDGGYDPNSDQQTSWWHSRKSIVTKQCL